jgi:signal peptidase II
VRKEYYLLAIISSVVIVLDQISKLIVVRSIPAHDAVPVINGFFNLVHARNRGMAFGLMNRSHFDLFSYILVAATFVAIVLLVYWFSRIRTEDKILVFGFSLILGGAVGNLIDRVRFLEVIDFLDFYLGSYHWPAFNVADSAITVGALGVALYMLFQHSTKT